jgi:hypothetical protein
MSSLMIFVPFSKRICGGKRKSRFQEALAKNICFKHVRVPSQFGDSFESSASSIFLSIP